MDIAWLLQYLFYHVSLMPSAGAVVIANVQFLVTVFITFVHNKMLKTKSLICLIFLSLQQGVEEYEPRFPTR